VSWSDTQIVATVAPGTRTGPVKVITNSISNLDVAFAMPNPVVNSVSPTTGPTGTPVQIFGAGFGATQGTSTALFNGNVANIVTWSDTAITATVSSTAAAGPVSVVVGNVTSNTSINFNVPAPLVTSITPNNATAGTQVTVTGSNFQFVKGTNSNLLFSGFNAWATITSWSDTQIAATVPTAAQLGPIWVSVNAVSSNSDTQFALISPRVTGISPTSGPVGTQVQINGTGFGLAQGSTVVRFAGFTASVVSWSDTQIVATVPASAPSGAVTVIEAGITSNSNANFTVPKPRITTVSPATGNVGTNVTITGSGFQAAPGNSFVYFNGMNTSSPVSWSDTQIVIAVPAGATSGAVKVISNNGDTSNQDLTFSLPNPIIIGLVPANGPVGTQVQINGSGFGTTQSSNTITFSNNPATVVSWSDTQIVATVPSTAISGPVKVTSGGVVSNAGLCFNVPPPTVTSISPTVGGIGNTVTITGTGFQSAMPQSGHVMFNAGSGGSIKSWSDTQIVAIIPVFTVTGYVGVTLNGVFSNYVNYTVPGHTITSLTPSTGPVGTQVTIAGNAFGSPQGTSTLTFNGQTATVSSWTNTQIVATVPVAAASGPAVVAISGANSNADKVFTIPPPNVSNFQPNGGNPGTTVTIHGTGFQANQRDSTITFYGIPAAVTSWSDTQIVAAVPTGAHTGPLLVNVNSVPSQNNSLTQFEVPYPVITSITPPESPAGGTITITGSGFGPGQWYSPDGVSVVYVGFVNFNGVQGGAVSWSDTSITATVPSTASSGNITITKYDATSAGAPFTVEGAPAVASLSPDNGPVDSTVTITGSGFGSTQSTSTVQFKNTQAFVNSWSDTSITAVVPAGASTGPVTVTVAGVSGPTSKFTLTNSVQVTDSLGNITSYHFEQLGGQWNYSRQSGTGCSSCEVQGTLNLTKGSATHNDSADVTSTTDELTHTTTYTWDSDHNLLSESTPLDANNTVVNAHLDLTP
jgi:YD repeat-containing protein